MCNTQYWVFDHFKRIGWFDCSDITCLVVLSGLQNLVMVLVMLLIINYAQVALSCKFPQVRYTRLTKYICIFRQHSTASCFAKTKKSNKTSVKRIGDYCQGWKDINYKSSEQGLLICYESTKLLIKNINRLCECYTPFFN